MKKSVKALSLLSFLLFSIFSHAQTPEWVYQYVHPSSSNEWSSAIVVDSTGNSYTTGVLSSDDTTGGHISGICVIKLNTLGQEQWIYFNDTLARHAYGNDIALSHSCNRIYTAGYSQSLSGNKDLIVLSIDTLGNTLWIYRDSLNLEGNAIGVSSSHNIYTAGMGWGVSLNWVVIKLDSLGNEKWRYVYDGPAGSFDQTSDIAIDKDENVYVGGYSTGVGTAEDFTVIKIDSAGNEKWVYRYDGPASQRDELKAITLDTLGNIYMTGWSWGIDWDYATVKIDTAGQENWVCRYNGPGNGSDLVYDLVVDDEGNTYVCGGAKRSDGIVLFTVIKIDSLGNEGWCYATSGPADNGGFAWCITLDGLGGIYAGGQLQDTSNKFQITVVRLNTSGQELWTYIYPHVPPSVGADVTRDIVVDVAGNVYVTGRIALSTFDDDIVVMKFVAQPGTKEVASGDMLDNYNITSIFRRSISFIPEQNGRLYIHDVLGRLLVNKLLHKEQKEYIKLQPGVYFLMVEGQGHVTRKKIIIL